MTTERNRLISLMTRTLWGQIQNLTNVPHKSIQIHFLIVTMGNANLKPPMTEAQYNAMAIIRIVFSIPSVIGSIYIVQHVMRSKKRRERTRFRILLGMSMMDLIFSLTTVASVAPVPEGLFTYAIGTWASCEAFGFLKQGARLSSIIYNASLTLYYLLTIRYGWTERRLRGKEWWLHLVPLSIGWSTAIACLPLTLYNPTPVGCGIAVPYPLGCPYFIPCERGQYSNEYQLAFFFVPLWIVFVFLVVAMCMIYYKIAATEKASELYQGRRSLHSSSMDLHRDPPSNLTVSTTTRRKKRSLSRQFAVQALLYCLAFGITWFFASIVRILKEWKLAYIPLVFLNIALVPLQGYVCIASYRVPYS